jgi:dTDP-glucose pyrophosphorylase
MAQIIKCDSSVVEALAAINDSDLLTVFVVDEKNVLVGTLTDGDVRRYLINGGQLNDPVVNAVKKSFSKIEKKDSDTLKSLKEFKAKGIKLVPVLNSKGEIEDVYDLVNYKSHLPIDAVLMAGGKGERLRPLTEKTPKPLLPVGDKCIIDHNVDRLISYGVKHISVTVNYLKEQIEEHYSTPRNGIKVNTCREPKYLGTIGSIKFVETFYNDSVLVMNSDLFTNIDYEDFYLHFKQHDADMSVAAVPYDVSIPYGILDLDGRDIKGLLEKPKYNYYANAGIYLIKKSALAEIPEDTFFNATDLIEKLISENKKVVRYPLNGTWIDIGNPQEYQKAKDLVKHLS